MATKVGRKKGGAGGALGWAGFLFPEGGLVAKGSRSREMAGGGALGGARQLAIWGPTRGAAASQDSRSFPAFRIYQELERVPHLNCSFLTWEGVLNPASLRVR